MRPKASACGENVKSCDLTFVLVETQIFQDLDVNQIASTYHCIVAVLKSIEAIIMMFASTCYGKVVVVVVVVVQNL